MQNIFIIIQENPQESLFRAQTASSEVLERPKNSRYGNRLPQTVIRPSHRRFLDTPLDATRWASVRHLFESAVASSRVINEVLLETDAHQLLINSAAIEEIKVIADQYRVNRDGLSDIPSRNSAHNSAQIRT